MVQNKLLKSCMGSEKDLNDGVFLYVVDIGTRTFLTLGDGKSQKQLKN